jgi:hypothetical protein
MRTLETIISYPEQGREADILRCFMDLVPSYRPSPTGLGRYLTPAAAEPRPAREPRLSAIA